MPATRADAMSILNGHVREVADSSYFRVLFPIAVSIACAAGGIIASDIRSAQSNLQNQVYALSADMRTGLDKVSRDAADKFTVLQSQLGSVQTSVTALTATFAVRVETMMREGDELKKRLEKMDDRIDACCRSMAR